MSRAKADHKLIGGPYRPPRVRVGDSLFCDLHGEVVMRAFTDRLRWPCALLYGQRSPILTGDLVRAVRTESAMAVVWWWEVSRNLVHRWRVCLSVGRKTPGTLRLRRERCSFSRQTLALALAAQRTPAWRERNSEARKRYWEHRRRAGLKAHGGQRLWTAREVRLLGTASDAAVGRRIGRTRPAVGNKRRGLGIPPAGQGSRT